MYLIESEYAESICMAIISCLYRKYSPGKFTEQRFYMCIYRSRHGQAYSVYIL